MTGLPTLVVATWNHLEITQRFLKSLYATSRENWRVIFVDNGSSDDTAEWLESNATQERFEVQVIRNLENRGCAKAWNQGIREALQQKAPLIGILNNDLVFATGWDTALLKFWRDHHSSVRAFAPHPVSWTLESFDKQAQKFMTRNASRTRFRMRSEAMFFEANVFSDVGLYDEDYFVSFEDFDYFLRLERAGIRPVETGSSVIWHQEKSSRKDLPNHEIEGKEIFVSKWGVESLRHPGFEIPRGTRRLWRWRERLGIL
jgi:N-acetylglucosaminyl-diphospho-decaprenol L-rhamnosyltransferase